MSEDDTYSRPRRERNPKKTDKNDFLDKLKRAKQSGRNLKQETQVEDIYDIVNEETYEKLKEKRQLDNFIEGDSEYMENGKEIFDESDDEEIKINKAKRTKSMKNLNIKNPKKVRLDFKANNENSQKSLFSIVASSKTGKKKNEGNTTKLDDLIGELVTSKQEDKVIKNPFLSKKKDMKFNINQPKEVGPSINKPIEKKQVHKNKATIQAPLKFVKENIVFDEACSQKNVSPSKTKMIKVSQENSCRIEDDIVLDDIDFNEPFDTINEPTGFATEIKSEDHKSLWENEEMEIETLNDNCDPFENIDKSLLKLIYWFDAYHDKKIPGVVFLFGKIYDETTKKFVNTCIRIYGLERRIYVLPRDQFEMSEVYSEVKSLLAKHGVESLRTKPVTRKYAFQFTDVPDEAEYLMVQYDSKYPELPNGLSGKTFSRIFGTNTSCLEMFILDLKLKGPCWLSFNGLESPSDQFSTCKLNFEVKGIKGIKIEKEKSPPFSILSLNVKTVVNKKFNVNEIVAVGGFIHNEIYLDRPPPNNMFQNNFIIITHPKDFPMPYDLNQKLSSEWGANYKNSVFIESNERSLISCLLNKLQHLDPDIIVGHSLIGYQLEILLQRCQVLNINTWYKLGRLKRSIVLPKVTGNNTTWIERMATAGRLLCDVEVSARELIKCRSYEQRDLIEEILPEKFKNLTNSVSMGDLTTLFVNSGGIKHLIDLTLDESLVNISLMHELQVLPLALEITTICGNLMCRTLFGGKSERNEYLLLHAFNEKEYIVPDKAISHNNKNVPVEIDELNDQKFSKRKPTYAGGLVLEPKRGLYENFILLMDFNSLYPSIILEYNICFTTIDRSKYLNVDDTDGVNSELGNQTMSVLMDLSRKSACKPAGILPTEIRKLVESRNIVKQLLNNPNLSKEKRLQHDIRQKALKITANSMYGCLGFSQSRFQATQLAALVTFHGREILINTKKIIEDGCKFTKGINSNFTLDIIYGDTDSVMVNTGIRNVNQYDQVLKIGQLIKDEVNKRYNGIQLNIDGVMRRILLLNKKKYASLNVVSREKNSGKLILKQEHKGLDIVRRDWCKLSIEVGKRILTMILEEELLAEDLAFSIHNYIKSVSDDMRNSKISLEKFIITKALTRNPENYSNPQGQPHVQVALRINKASGVIKQFRAKDTVEYIICIDGTSESATQRAYSPKEVLDSTMLPFGITAIWMITPGTGDRKLSIDYNYYLAHQLHPVICRLIETIELMDASTIADNLGLDSSKYRQNNVSDERDNIISKEESVNEANRFIGCKPLPIACRKCQHKTIIDFKMEIERQWLCANCNCDLLSTAVEAVHISKQINAIINRLIQLYYSSISQCQCGYICRGLVNVCNEEALKYLMETGKYLCPKCENGAMKPLISSSLLYQQLSYYQFLLTGKENLSYKHKELLETLRKYVEAVLECSAYNKVNFKSLMAKLSRNVNNCLIY